LKTAREAKSKTYLHTTEQPRLLQADSLDRAAKISSRRKFPPTQSSPKLFSSRVPLIAAKQQRRLARSSPIISSCYCLSSFSFCCCRCCHPFRRRCYRRPSRIPEIPAPELFRQLGTATHSQNSSSRVGGTISAGSLQNSPTSGGHRGRSPNTNRRREENIQRECS